jgi:predicted RND superfamily exporter protein
MLHLNISTIGLFATMAAGSVYMLHHGIKDIYSQNASIFITTGIMMMVVTTVMFLMSIFIYFRKATEKKEDLASILSDLKIKAHHLMVDRYEKENGKEAHKFQLAKLREVLRTRKRWVWNSIEIQFSNTIGHWMFHLLKIEDHEKMAIEEGVRVEFIEKPEGVTAVYVIDLNKSKLN